jgi:hypothetical protein
MSFVSGAAAETCIKDAGTIITIAIKIAIMRLINLLLNSLPSKKINQPPSKTIDISVW